MAQENSYTSGKIPDYGVPMKATYHSIGGTSIKATFGGLTFGNLQAISVSIVREKVPIVTMGSPSPRGFARGKRAIAGSFIMIMFDSHALLEAFRHLSESDHNYRFVAGKDERRPSVFSTHVQNPSAGSLTPFQNPTSGVNTAAQLFNHEMPIGSGSALQDSWEKSIPWYADQIPPFNVVLTGVSEYGYAITMAILGVEILNEGYGVSIDDHVSEQQFSYAASEVSPWTRIRGADFQKDLAFSSPVAGQVKKG